MIGVAVEGSFLDLFPDTQLDLLLNSPVFSDAEKSYIPGSYTFPLKVPVTGTNRKILNYPDNLQVINDGWDSPTTCEIYFQGKKIINGFITKTNATVDKVIEIYFVQNRSKSFKTLKLTDLDLGEINVSDNSEMVGLAQNSLDNPDDYNFVFAPVYVPEIDPLPYTNPFGATSDIYFQNQYIIGTGSTLANNLNSPFIKAIWILRKIYEVNGYEVHNFMEVDDELKNLIHFSNLTINKDDNNFQLKVPLNQHVPNIACNEYLKSILNLFGAAPYPDPLSKSVEIIPVRDILKKSPLFNWTLKISTDIEIKKSTEAAQSYNHASNTFDESYVLTDSQTFNRPPLDFVSFDTGYEMREYFHNNPDEGGFRYVKQNDIYYEMKEPGVFLPFFHHDRYVKYSVDINSEKEFVSEVYPLRANATIMFVAGAVYVIHTISRYEYCIPYQEKKADVPNAISFYRGYSTDNPYPDTDEITYDHIPYPVVLSDIQYLGNGETKFNYSLMWQGEKGLWAVWHKEFFEKCIRHYTENTFKVNLLLSDIINFRFYELVKIGSSTYIVKSLRIKFTMKGILPAEAVLVQIRG